MQTPGIRPGAGLLAAAPAVQAQVDVKGGQDHPLVTRMPGFYITSYDVEEFAAFDPTVMGGKDTHWEGKKYTIGYDLKEGAAGVSTLQIVRNHVAAIRKIGGTLPGGDERRMTGEIRKGGAMTGVYCRSVQRRPQLCGHHRRVPGDNAEPLSTSLPGCATVAYTLRTGPGYRASCASPVRRVMPSLRA